MAKFKVGDRVRCQGMIATLKRLIPEPELFHGEWEAVCDDGGGAIFREDQIELIESDPLSPEERTLRDQFAMAALTSMAPNSAHTDEDFTYTARKAYGFADAMLAERDRVK